MAEFLSDRSRDTIFNGRITLVQPRQGYRFAIDALLLAYFATVPANGVAVDLGAGTGVVALALADRQPNARILAVEVQPRLAECARINVAANPAGSRIEVLEMDWRGITLDDCHGPVQTVVSNPPYHELGSGRINPNVEAAMARHELTGSAATAAEAAARILAPGGLFFLIFPAPRLVGLFTDLRAAGFEPKRLRLVHSRSGERARLALVEARLGGRPELEVAPPVYVYQSGQQYSEETEAILAGRRTEI